jgi:integrative and conjugative element protein (TIGR02256 family)
VCGDKVVIEFSVLGSGQRLRIHDRVIQQFRRHRQLRPADREAGGQLFARFDSSKVIVEEATGPRTRDRRTAFGFWPDRKAEQREINHRHRKGLHYVGDWHTHPEDRPQASKMDEVSIRECFLKSKHDLDAFILIIVGRLEGPKGLLVAVHDGRRLTALAGEVQEQANSLP